MAGLWILYIGFSGATNFSAELTTPKVVVLHEMVPSSSGAHNDLSVWVFLGGSHVLGWLKGKPKGKPP